LLDFRDNYFFTINKNNLVLSKQITKNQQQTTILKSMKNTLWSVVVFFLLSPVLFAQNAELVTPNVSHKAKALLELLYSISGKHMLSGQHNFPISRAKNSEFTAEYTRKTPAVWSQDFGFSKEGGKDSVIVEPIKAWTPTVATSGLVYYNHTAIPEWKNSLLNSE